MVALVSLNACKSKVNVSANHGASFAQTASKDIESGVKTSLSDRSLDKTKSAAVASAAGTAAASANTSGASVEAQAAAAMSAAIQTIYTQFSASTSDISLASLGSFEGITGWLITKNSSKSVEENIKAATTAVLNVIAANPSSNTLAAITGIFGNAHNVSISGKTLSDYSSSVIAAIAALIEKGDSTLTEICKTAVAQLTTSVIKIAIAADTFRTTIAALFKAVTGIGPSLNSATAAATVKTLLEQISTSAATAIAASSLSTSAKTTDLADLKTAAALAVDNLATTAVIPSVDVATLKTNINTLVDAAVTATATPTPTPTPTATSTPAPVLPPVINIKQGVTSLASGSGSQAFGSVAAASGTADVVFTIENTGTGALTLSGTPKAALSGTDAGDFSVTVQPAATVAASGTTTFTVRFAPTTGGAKTATVTVANDDSNEGTYTFAVTGTATTAPEINIKQGSTSLASGSGSKSFGSVVANSANADLTFTIENTGTATLNISGTPKAALSGADAAEFSVTSQPAATVAASGTTTFVIRFTPTSVAAKTATVTVANDDSDEGTYTFTITGNGTAAVTANSQVGNPGTFNQTNAAPAAIENWTNITNAVASDGAATTSSVMDEVKTATARLELTGFGFSSSIPSGATITGIQVEINRRGLNMVNGATCRDLAVQLIITGPPSGVNLADTATDWPGVHTSATYGSSTNLWTLTPTAAEIRAADFGVAITAQANLPNATGSCTADIEYVKITVSYTPATYQIFTTSVQYDGNLGGLSGADAKCQARAALGSLTGTWKAILSDATTDANTRLTFASGINFVNMQGATVATSTADLWDGIISAGVHYDQSGFATASDAWTGTNSNGTKSVGFMCNSWTNATNGFSGLAGVPSDVGNNTYWVAIGGSTCDLFRALMCVNQ